MKAIKILGLLICLITLNIKTGLAQEATLTDSVKQFIEDSFRDFSNSNYSDWEGLAVTITSNDQYWSTTIGKANDSGKLVDENNKWLFRSFTKLIVSTVILQLHEEEFIDIKAPISQYLDPIQNVNMDDTIEDLLQMRSRTCQYLNSSSSVWIEVAQNSDAILDTKTMLEKHIPDGTCNSSQGFDYNDANFQVLGLIIEAVTGKSGEEVLDERIFTPNGMQNTSLAPINLTRDDFNGLYSGDFDDPNPHDQSAISLNAALTSQKFSAGVMGSTKDMLKFLKRLMDGDILEAETFELMKINPSSSGYGMGLMIQTMSGMNGNIPVFEGTYYGHGGGGLNTSRTFYDPVRKIGFSYAYNSGSNTPQSDYNTELFKEATYYYLRTCIEYGGCTELEEIPNEHNELAGELQQILDDNIPNYGIEGVATTIVFPNDEVHTIGSGYGQNVNDPVDLEKRWHWASGTKPMTGYVTIKLIEDGVLSIDDPVGKFLDTNSIPNLDSTITLKRLLQHTSGLSEIWSSSNNSALWQEVWGDRDRVWNPREFLNYIPAPFDGLTEHYYANTNSYILSFIIEEVTGKSLEDNFQEFIFDPLGMTSSYLSSGKDIDMSEFNGAWLGNDNRSFLSHTSYLSSRSGNSAHIATSEDAVKFYRSYYSSVLLPDDLMDDVKEPAAGSSEVIFENYACISKVTQLHGYETTMFEVIDTDGHAWNLYGHGGNGIHNSFTYHWEQKDLTIAMVINDFQVLEPSPFAALIFDVLCKLDAELDDVEIQPEVTPGKLVERTFTHDGSTREYSIYEPKNYDSNSIYPLILNFHGYTGDVDDHINRTQMHDLADEHGFLIAYPVGLTITRDPNILPAFVPATGAGWSVPGFSNERNEIQFVESFLNDIESQYSIDEYRIHTTGLSLGGYMAAYIATQMPDRIASFASVAGHMTEEVFELLGDETQKSGLLIHGTQDIVTDYNGLNNEYQSVEAVANKLALNNNCSVDPTQSAIDDIDTSDNTTVTLFTYSDCDVVNETGLNVKLYRVNEGGHRWPGSGITEPAGLGFNSKDISSSKIILEFFEENPYAGIIDSKEEFSNPSTFKLSQNYPNPFNPSTNISFELPQSELVQLKVYNLLGQEVANLVDGRMNTGNHTVNFDASQLSSGVYIYRLVAGDQAITKKMMLIK